MEHGVIAGPNSPEAINARNLRLIDERKELAQLADNVVINLVLKKDFDAIRSATELRDRLKKIPS